MQFSLGGMLGKSLTTKRNTFGVGSLIGLLILGAMFLGIGGIIVASSQIDSTWTRVDGTVVGSDRSSTNDSAYTPIVSYTVNGATYQVKSSISTSSYPTVGSTMQVAYSPSSPANAKIVAGKSTMVLLLIFPAIGLIMLILAPVLFVRSRKRGQAIEQLIQTGQKVTGVMTDIKQTGSKNGSSTYKLVVSAADASGTVRQYTSDSLTGMIGLVMASFQGKAMPIDVYLDPGNPDHYYVDISDIPSLDAQSITRLVNSARSSMPGAENTPGVLQAAPTPAPQARQDPPQSPIS